MHFLLFLFVHLQLEADLSLHLVHAVVRLADRLVSCVQLSFQLLLLLDHPPLVHDQLCNVLHL